MRIKSVSRLNRVILLLSVVSTMALVGAVSGNAEQGSIAKAAPVADAGGGLDARTTQATTSDRISFYNVPSDHKLESQIDYADGRAEKIQYPAALCASGTVLTQQLNLYAVTFVAEGCGATVFQNLNLRWMGGCQFEFEHDPEARLIARGPYGETVVGEGHYPAGALQLTNLPANTTSLAATMTYTNAQGQVQTGNVEFTFKQPHPGCSQASTPTSTSTPTPTATTETATSTSTTTPTATIETATPTATDIPPVGLVATDTPAPTITPTVTALPVVLPPTGLDPVGEPKSPTSIVYLPLLLK